MNKFLLVLLMLFCPLSYGQSLYDSLRVTNTGLSAYIFVSANLSDTTLIALARDAKRGGVNLVLNGFINNTPQGFNDTKRKVAEINAVCCGEKGGAHWQINPILFQRYHITAIPAFVIARGTSDKPEDYSKISGEMSLGNALKFFAQQSKISDIRKKAGEVYMKSFSDQ